MVVFQTIALFQILLERRIRFYSILLSNFAFYQ